MLPGLLQSGLTQFKCQALVDPGDNCNGRESLVSRKIEEIVLN